MDRLLPYQQLNINDQLVSNHGRVRLVLQGDGNLVLYRTDDGRALWASNTHGTPVSAAVMQDDGNFVAYAADGHPYWATGTDGHPGSVLVLQDDGNLVVYGPDGAPLWASNTVQHFGPAFVPGFTPSTRAPLFHNGPWPAGTSLAISVFGLPPVNIDVTRMGLCGGMSFLARDIFEAGTPQLRNSRAVDIPPALAQHVLRRLLDSFSGPGVVNRWISLTQALDHDTIVWGAGTFHQSVNEVAGIVADIDAGVLCPIGLVLTQSYAAWDVFQNHVVLVWGYERHGDILTLHTYDCNFEGRDDITIALDISATSPARTISTNGTDNAAKPGTIRGFFRLPYVHADPASAYIDDASVTTHLGPPNPASPGSTVPVRVDVVNTGSTIWTPGQSYRLGSQAPQDNTNWGRNRTDLPWAEVNPGQRVSFNFNATVPAVPGTYAFCWQMVRDGVHWFGRTSPPVSIPVGATAGICAQLHQQYAALAAELASVRAEIETVDWSDPFTARRVVAPLNLKARAIQKQLSAVAARQSTAGCAPG